MAADSEELRHLSVCLGKAWRSRYRDIDAVAGLGTTDSVVVGLIEGQAGILRKQLKNARAVAASSGTAGKCAERPEERADAPSVQLTIAKAIDFAGNRGLRGKCRTDQNECRRARQPAPGEWPYG